MAQELYKVIVPGSAMLLGEHAVLSNGQAVVCAIDKYMHITLEVIKKNKSPRCTIVSPTLGILEISIDNFEIQAPFTFVLQAIKSFSEELKNASLDIQLTIESDFSSTIGFGSSSAVTAAVVAVIYKFINKTDMPLDDIFNQSYKIIRDVQKVGSGADVAASVYGGVISYDAKSYKVIRLPDIPDFYLIYCGYKTPTPVVIKYVEECFKNDHVKLSQIYSDIHQTVVDGAKCIQNKNYTNLNKVFDKAYLLQKELQVSDNVLDEIVNLSGSGTKISGSGLGDCVITFNEPSFDKYQIYPVKVSSLGVTYVY